MPIDMPTDLTAEQAEVRRRGRQRLIGAIALALAAVVFVPMLLDPEPRRDRAEPLLAIPPKEGAAPLVTAPRTQAPATATAPATAEPAARPAIGQAEPPKAEPVQPEPAKAAPGSAAPARKTVPPKTAELASAAPKAAPAKAPPESKPAPSSPALQGFAVQVGAFKDEGKLKQARDRVAAARLPHYTERLEGASGELTRLRAGPFPTREAAEKAASQLKRAGLDGRVVTLP
jgi:DedD protein